MAPLTVQPPLYVSDGKRFASVCLPTWIACLRHINTKLDMSFNLWSNLRCCCTVPSWDDTVTFFFRNLYQRVMLNMGLEIATLQ